MNTETKLNLRVGGVYLTRGGLTARILEALSPELHDGLKWGGMINGVEQRIRWDANGEVFCSGGIMSIDIVAEIGPEPEPEVSQTFGSPESWAEVEAELYAMPTTGKDTGEDIQPYRLAEPSPPPGVVAITAALRTLVAAIEFHAEALPVPVGDAITLAHLALGARA